MKRTLRYGSQSGVFTLLLLVVFFVSPSQPLWIGDAVVGAVVASSAVGAIASIRFGSSSRERWLGVMANLGSVAIVAAVLVYVHGLPWD